MQPLDLVGPRWQPDWLARGQGFGRLQRCPLLQSGLVFAWLAPVLLRRVEARVLVRVQPLAPPVGRSRRAFESRLD